MGARLDRFLYGAAAPARRQERSLVVPWYGLDTLSYGGSRYFVQPTTLYGPAEPVDRSGCAMVGNGTVYGIVRSRVDLFSQVRFVWKRFGAGPRPMASDVFTDAALSPLDNPAGLLEWCELDVANFGNSFWVLDGPVLRRLPAPWCTIVLGSPRGASDPEAAWDAVPVGLVYDPPTHPDQKETFLWSEVAHYAPERDPEARWRGMSYLRPAMEDIASDNSARRFLTKYWENGATPNLVMVFPPEVVRETVEAFRDAFLAKHSGVERAFRTGFIGGGADPRVVGANLKDLDSEHVRNQVHRDIAMAAGVPPMAIGLLEVNYSNTKESNRALADRKLRYLWLRLVEAFRPLIGPVPRNAELWYDASGVSALQSDALDDAEVQSKQAVTIRQLTDGGWDPTSVKDAVMTGDFGKLAHTGLLSVQMQPPGAGTIDGAAPDQGGGNQ